MQREGPGQRGEQLVGPDRLPTLGPHPVLGLPSAWSKALAPALENRVCAANLPGLVCPRRQSCRPPCPLPLVGPAGPGRCSLSSTVGQTTA